MALDEVENVRVKVSREMSISEAVYKDDLEHV